MKLSVMMITYNHERFIAQAIQSVLDQQVAFDYELLIGEDCSTDRTGEIVKDFYRRYPYRIVPILRDKNVGMMRNFMGTMAACQGQYVAMLEGDDYWTCEDKLQRQVDFLDAHPDYAVCCGRVEVQNEMGTEESGILPLSPAGTYMIDDLLRGNFIWPCTSVCRWGLLQGLPRWLEEMNLGDWPLHVLTAQFGNINLMDEVLAVYRVHSGGVWSSRSQMSRLQETLRMLRMLDVELGFRYTSTIRQTVARSYLAWGAILAQQNGSRIEASKCLLNGLQNGAQKLLDARPTLKGLAWYVLLGSWHPVLARVKRALLH